MAKKISRQALTGVFSSRFLRIGTVYSRQDLRTQFQITDANLKNGIFKPKAYDSVWIFITEQKSADRTQYEDFFIDDVLHMEGQLKGRTDHLINEHAELGLELLLFYRKKKYEHPGAGFTFEGRLLYLGHQGSGPTKFTLRRVNAPMLEPSDIEAELKNQGEFDPDDVVDARKRTLASIIRRQGQSAFRKRLLKAYAGQCAVTGCNIEALLEAAHIAPYLGADTNVVSNGLLLRADIHTLFDLGLLWVTPDNLFVGMTDELKSSEYRSLENKALSLPAATADRPSAKALQVRFDTLQQL